MFRNEIETGNLEETFDIIFKNIKSKKEMNDMNKKLYYIVVKNSFDTEVFSFYVVSLSSSDAEAKVKEFLSDAYSNFTASCNFISRIDVIAEEGMYGLSVPLIVG